MKGALAFDVYGTLVDPMAVVADLERLIGPDATSFATLWRAKQLEYLFRRGLGRKYQAFTVCTRQALGYTCQATSQDLGTDQRDRLMARWNDLPAYQDARTSLARLRDAGFHLYAFSNGEPDVLDAVLANAGLDDLFRGVVSVHETRSFKPDPSVYAFFLENTGALLGSTWLVSANSFDVIGAMEVGWKAIWVKRDPRMVFDPWEVAPTGIVGSLDDVIYVCEFYNRLYRNENLEIKGKSN